MGYYPTAAASTSCSSISNRQAARPRTLIEVPRHDSGPTASIARCMDLYVVLEQFPHTRWHFETFRFPLSFTRQAYCLPLLYLHYTLLFSFSFIFLLSFPFAFFPFIVFSCKWHLLFPLPLHPKRNVFSRHVATPPRQSVQLPLIWHCLKTYSVKISNFWCCRSAAMLTKI